MLSATVEKRVVRGLRDDMASAIAIKQQAVDGVVAELGEGMGHAGKPELV